MLSSKNGQPVPAGERCVFCGKGPTKGERYGTRPADWDAPGRICPDCFPKKSGGVSVADTPMIRKKMIWTESDDPRTLYEWGDEWNPRLRVSDSPTKRRVTISAGARSVAIEYEDIAPLLSILYEEVIREMALRGEAPGTTLWKDFVNTDKGSRQGGK